MADRINEGYAITDSIQIGDIEYVFGELEHGKIPMYVTWACKGRNNYFWGHYFSDPLEAKKDLLIRANEELEYQMERKARAAERQPREPDKECER